MKRLSFTSMYTLPCPKSTYNDINIQKSTMSFISNYAMEDRFFKLNYVVCVSYIACDIMPLAVFLF